MNGFERVRAAIYLQKADRTPVAPLIIGYAAACAGVRQSEVYGSFEAWLAALDRTYDRIGLCDMVFPRWPYDVARMQMLPFRLPGRELDDDCQAQVIEAELMKREDYPSFVSGYTRWFFSHLARILGKRPRFPLCMPLLIPTLLGINIRARRVAARWEGRGVPVGFDSACYPPFDLLSLVRSLEPFFSDLMDCPELVEKACAASVAAIAASAKMPLRFSKGRRITIYPMRSSASFISPAMFERFSLPYLSALVRDFHGDGIVSVLHCDGNWTPMLAHLRSLPARSCVLEFDEKTNMVEAKRILGDRQCLKGNISAHALAFGSPREVTAQCVDLIREVGHDGGFILSSGCEVPVNARLDNVRAMVASVSEA